MGDNVLPGKVSHDEQKFQFYTSQILKHLQIIHYW